MVFNSRSLLYYFGIEFAGAGAGVCAAGAAGAAGVTALGMPAEPVAAGAAGTALSITPPLTAPLVCWVVMYDSASVALKKTAAATPVDLDMKFDEPVAPNRLPEAPEPKAAPISAPLPCCSKTRPMMARAETTWMMTTRLFTTLIQHFDNNLAYKYCHLVVLSVLPGATALRVRLGVDDGKEICRLQRCAADQAAIDVRLRHQFPGVLGLHAAAVQNLYLGRHNLILFGDTATQEMVRFLRHLRGGGLAGTDGPYRLIGQHDVGQLVARNGVQRRLQLGADRRLGIAGFALIERFAHADHRRQTGSQRHHGFLRHQLTRFAVVRTALRVTDQHVAGTEVDQHRGRHFARVRAAGVDRQVLAAPGDRGIAQFALALRQIRRRHADRAVGAVVRILETGDNAGQQGCIDGAAAVHFPIADNQFASHTVVRVQNEIPACAGMTTRCRQRYVKCLAGRKCVIPAPADRPPPRPASSNHLQHDFSDVGAAFHQRMRCCRLLQREHRVDHRLDLALGHQRPHALDQLFGNCALELGRTGTQRRTGHRQAAEQQLSQVQLGLGAAQRGNQRQAAVVGQGADFAWHVVAAHHVQDHIDAASVGQRFHDLHEIFRLVIDAAFGAQRLARRHLVGAAGRGEHAVAHGAGQLDGRHADAGRAALHQQGFAADQMGAVEHIAPHGKIIFRDRGRFQQAPAFGHGHDLGDRRHAVFRIAAALHQRAHVVADVERGVIEVAVDDFAGHFQAGQVGRAGRRIVGALALEDVGTVDAGRMHLDQDFAGFNDRHGTLAQLEHVGGTGMGESRDARRLPLPLPHPTRLRLPRQWRVRFPCGRERLAFRHLFLAHVLEHGGALFRRIGRAARCRQVPQHVGDDVILRHATHVIAVHQAHDLQRLGMALLGGLGEPAHGLLVVLDHGVAGVIHGAYHVLGIGLALQRGLAVPLERLLVVLRHAASHVVHQAHQVLGIGVAGAGQWRDLLERRAVVLVVVGGDLAQAVDLDVAVQRLAVHGDGTQPAQIEPGATGRAGGGVAQAAQVEVDIGRFELLRIQAAQPAEVGLEQLAAAAQRDAAGAAQFELVDHGFQAAGAVHHQFQVLPRKTADVGGAHAFHHHLAQVGQHHFGARAGAGIDLDGAAAVRFQVQRVARLRRGQLVHVALVAGDLQRRRGALAQLDVNHTVDLDPHHAGVDGDSARFGRVVGRKRAAQQRPRCGKQQTELEQLLHDQILGWRYQDHNAARKTKAPELRRTARFGGWATGNRLARTTGLWPGGQSSSISFSNPSSPCKRVYAETAYRGSTQPVDGYSQRRQRCPQKLDSRPSGNDGAGASDEGSSAPRLPHQVQPRPGGKGQVAAAPPGQHQLPVQRRLGQHGHRELAAWQRVAEQLGQDGDAHAQPHQRRHEIPLAAAAADLGLEPRPGAGIGHDLVERERFPVKDERTVGQLTQRHRLASAPARLGRRQQAQGRAHQRERIELLPDMGVARVVEQRSHFQRAAAQVRFDRLRAAFEQFEFNVRMPAVVRRQQRRQGLVRLLRDAQAQLAAAQLLQVRQLHVQFLVHGQQRAPARQHHAARIGERKALAHPFEQHQVQRLLQLGDHLAHRGLPPARLEWHDDLLSHPAFFLHDSAGTAADRRLGRVRPRGGLAAPAVFRRRGGTAADGGAAAGRRGAPVRGRSRRRMAAVEHAVVLHSADRLRGAVHRPARARGTAPVCRHRHRLHVGAAGHRADRGMGMPVRARRPAAQAARRAAPPLPLLLVDARDHHVGHFDRRRRTDVHPVRAVFRRHALAGMAAGSRHRGLCAAHLPVPRTGQAPLAGAGPGQLRGHRGIAGQHAAARPPAGHRRQHGAQPAGPFRVHPVRAGGHAPPGRLGAADGRVRDDHRPVRHPARAGAAWPAAAAHARGAQRTVRRGGPWLRHERGAQDRPAGRRRGQPHHDFQRDLDGAAGAPAGAPAGVAFTLPAGDGAQLRQQAVGDIDVLLPGRVAILGVAGHGNRGNRAHAAIVHAAHRLGQVRHQRRLLLSRQQCPFRERHLRLRMVLQQRAHEPHIRVHILRAVRDAGIEIVGADGHQDQVRPVIALVPGYLRLLVGNRQLIIIGQLEQVGPVVPRAHQPPAAGAYQLHLRAQVARQQHAVRGARIPPRRLFFLARHAVDRLAAGDGVAQHQQLALREFGRRQPAAVGVEPFERGRAVPGFGAVHHFHRVPGARQVLRQHHRLRTARQMQLARRAAVDDHIEIAVVAARLGVHRQPRAVEAGVKAHAGIAETGRAIGRNRAAAHAGHLADIGQHGVGPDLVALGRGMQKILHDRRRHVAIRLQEALAVVLVDDGLAVIEAGDHAVEFFHLRALGALARLLVRQHGVEQQARVRVQRAQLCHHRLHALEHLGRRCLAVEEIIDADGEHHQLRMQVARMAVVEAPQHIARVVAADAEIGRLPFAERFIPDLLVPALGDRVAHEQQVHLAGIGHLQVFLEHGLPAGDGHPGIFHGARRRGGAARLAVDGGGGLGGFDRCSLCLYFEAQQNHTVRRHLRFELAAGVARLPGPYVGPAEHRFFEIRRALVQVIVNVVLPPVEAHRRRRCAAIEYHQRPLAVVERLGPVLHVARVQEAPSGDAQLVLVDRNRILAGQRAVRGSRHLADVVPQDQRRRQHGPRREMRAVFVVGHALAHFQHVHIVPVARTGVLAQACLLVEDAHHAPRRERPLAEFAVPARVDIARGAPRMAHVLRPLPWLGVAPLANAEQHRAARAADGVAHGGVGAHGIQALAVAPVVLDVVDAPLGVRDRVLVFVAPAARPAAARGGAHVRVDADLQTLAVHIVGQRLHPGREAVGIGMDHALVVTLAVPAVVDVHVHVAGVLQAALDHHVGRVADQLFVDIAGKRVPAVPAHLRGGGQTLEFLGAGIAGQRPRARRQHRWHQRQRTGIRVEYGVQALLLLRRIAHEIVTRLPPVVGIGRAARAAPCPEVETGDRVALGGARVHHVEHFLVEAVADRGAGLDAERRAVAIEAEFFQHDGLVQLFGQLDVGIQVVAALGQRTVPGAGRVARIEPLPVLGPQVVRQVVDMPGAVGVQVQLRVLRGTGQALAAAADHVVAVQAMDVAGHVVDPFDVRRLFLRRGPAVAGPRLVGQLPGHQARVVRIRFTSDGVHALDDLGDHLAVLLLRGGVHVEARVLLHVVVVVLGDVGIQRRRAFEPVQVLRHAARPLPEVVQVKHHGHVALGRFGHQEVQAHQQVFVVVARLAGGGGADRAFHGGFFGDGQHPQVVDADGAHAVQFLEQALALAYAARRAQVAAVPEVGAHDVIRLALAGEMGFFGGDEVGLVSCLVLVLSMRRLFDGLAVDVQRLLRHLHGDGGGTGVAGIVRQQHLVAALGDAPGLAAAVEHAQQARIDGHAHVAALARRQLHLVPAAQALGRFPLRADRRQVNLRHVLAFHGARVGDLEAQFQLAVLARRRQAGIRERGIRQAVAEREQWLEALAVEPLVADGRALVVIDGKAHLLVFRIAIEPGTGQLAFRGREGRGQVAGRIDFAEQHAGNRLAAARTGIPRLQHGRAAVHPRHQHGARRLEHHHGFRIGGGHRIDQRILVVGQRQRHGVQRLAHPLLGEHDDRVGAGRQSGCGGGIGAVVVHHAGATGARLDFLQGRRRVVHHGPRPRERRDTGHRIAADRIHERRPAAGQHAHVRMGADHHDFFGARLERQDVAGVLEQHDALFRIRTADQAVSVEVDLAAGGHRMVDHALVEHGAQDAVGHVVQARLRHVAVGHRFLERAAEVLRLVELPARLLIEAAVGSFHGAVHGAPVGHHVAFISPVLFQYAVQQVVVLARVHAVQTVVRAHDGPGIGLLQHELERQQVGHAVAGVVETRVQHEAARLLVVHGKVLHGGDHVVRLDAPDLLRHHGAGQQRILARVFEIAAVARLAQQVHAAGQHHVKTRGARFGADHGAALVRQLPVPGGGGGQARWQRRALARGLARLRGHAQPGVGLEQRGQSQARHAGHVAGGKRQRVRVFFGLGAEVRTEVGQHPRQLFVLGHGGQRQLRALAGVQRSVEPGARCRRRFGGRRPRRHQRCGQRQGEGNRHGPQPEGNGHAETAARAVHSPRRQDGPIHDHPCCSCSNANRRRHHPRHRPRGRRVARHHFARAQERTGIDGSHAPDGARRRAQTGLRLLQAAAQAPAPPDLPAAPPAQHGVQQPVLFARAARRGGSLPQAGHRAVVHGGWAGRRPDRPDPHARAGRHRVRGLFRTRDPERAALHRQAAGADRHAAARLQLRQSGQYDGRLPRHQAPDRDRPHPRGLYFRAAGALQHPRTRARLPPGLVRGRHPGRPAPGSQPARRRGPGDGRARGDGAAAVAAASARRRVLLQRQRRTRCHALLPGARPEGAARYRHRRLRRHLGRRAGPPSAHHPARGQDGAGRAGRGAAAQRPVPGQPARRTGGTDRARGADRARQHRVRRLARATEYPDQPPLNPTTNPMTAPDFHTRAALLDHILHTKRFYDARCHALRVQLRHGLAPVRRRCRPPAPAPRAGLPARCPPPPAHGRLRVDARLARGRGACHRRRQPLLWPGLRAAGLQPRADGGRAPGRRMDRRNLRPDGTPLLGRAARAVRRRSIARLVPPGRLPRPERQHARVRSADRRVRGHRRTGVPAARRNAGAQHHAAPGSAGRWPDLGALPRRLVGGLGLQPRRQEQYLPSVGLPAGPPDRVGQAAAAARTPCRAPAAAVRLAAAARRAAVRRGGREGVGRHARRPVLRLCARRQHLRRHQVLLGAGREPGHRRPAGRPHGRGALLDLVRPAVGLQLDPLRRPRIRRVVPHPGCRQPQAHRPEKPGRQAAGEALTDMIVQDAAQQQWQSKVGGSTWNVARTMAALDVPTAFAGAVSCDVFGDALWQASAASRLDLRFLQRIDKSPLLAIVHRTDPPAYFFVGDDSADLHFDAAALPEGWRAHCQWVHFGGISLARQPLAGKLVALAEQLKRDGVRISFDPNYRLLMDERYDATLRRMTELADVVKVSEEDLAGLFRTDDIDTAFAILRSWNRQAAYLYTKGADGASLHCGDDDWTQAAPQITVADTVGAGDASIAALAYSMLYHPDQGPQRHLQCAVAAGAAACTVAGASPPSLAAIERLLAQMGD
uniref:Carbohydrate kinase PfkB domain-containing protein n=1 Tax=Tanacetum cinerariifolium TaxID=118510 RepID=A0A699GF91_TANCI|nr:hypothetical protein [Tanacetum cinerariifolium]